MLSISPARLLLTTVNASSRRQLAIRFYGARQRYGAEKARVRCHSTASTEHTEGIADNTTGPSKTIAFTSKKYPKLQRDSRFRELTADHVQYFQSIVKKSSALIDGVTKDATDDLEAFNGDWMRKYRGHTRLVVKPGNTEEVSAILKYCNDNMLAVVPQGGNTGLVGGSVPVFDEVVINLSRMSSIREFDNVSGILVADAGAILETVDGYLRDKEHIFPLDLGAKGSCQIGGNIATNAGGLRLLRYGSLHGTVIGLEVVLPDGTILNDLGKLRKNNTGYDIKQLFIGSEGTLGIVTAVSIVCPRKPLSTNVAILGLPSFAKAQTAFKEAKSQLSEILSAFELMDGKSQELVHNITGSKHPLEERHPFYCLVETSGSDAEHDSAKLERFLESVMENEIVSDGVVAQDETQASQLWGWRERITECLGHWGGVYKYDLSIPLPQLYQLVEDTRSRMRDQALLAPEGASQEEQEKYPVAVVLGYGHMGDSNLHLNIATRGFDQRVEKALEPWVYEWVKGQQGSISAEHGLGLAKRAYVKYSRDESSLAVMKRIRTLFDPVSLSFPHLCHLPVC